MSTASSNVTFKIRSGGDSASACSTAVNGKHNTPRGSPIAPSMRMPFECCTGVNNPGNVALALMAGARCPVDMDFVLKEATSKAVTFIHLSGGCGMSEHKRLTRENNWLNFLSVYIAKNIPI